jgi:hypothetical protein
VEPVSFAMVAQEGLRMDPRLLQAGQVHSAADFYTKGLPLWENDFSC